MRRRGGDDDLLTAVADPTRRRLLEALLDRGEATATALAADLPHTRQAIAKQLAVLHRSGLVEPRPQGREVRYAVKREQLDRATQSMAGIAAAWDERLHAIKRVAEAAHAAQRAGSGEETPSRPE